MWTPMYDEQRAQFTAEELVAHDAAMAQMIAIDGRLGNPSRDLVPLSICMFGEGSRYRSCQISSVNAGRKSIDRMRGVSGKRLSVLVDRGCCGSFLKKFFLI